ncbi:MAG: YigZ family protein [Spirochaetia bacterium]|nr:YigZ family protein [Spirochaetia bacterium]
MLVVPLEPASAELQVSNSRFLAELAPADSVDDARAFIARRKAAHPEATHHVPAFVVGGGNSVVEFCSDDGEPSGTSGRPLLAVLKGSGLGNAVIVVTRWFGGTLLGTGGLVKAYSEAGKLALASARRAVLSPSVRVAFNLPYHLYERARQLADGSGAQVRAETFLEDVGMELEVPVDAYPALESRLTELASGALQLRDLGRGVLRIAEQHPR